MDVITSQHGLAPLNPTQPMSYDDINKLSSELIIELERLRQDFTVDDEKLKEISKRFEDELQDGVLLLLIQVEAIRAK